MKRKFKIGLYSLIGLSSIVLMVSCGDTESNSNDGSKIEPSISTTTNSESIPAIESSS